MAIKVNVPFTYITRLFFHTLWYIALLAAYLGFSFPHTLKLWCSHTFKFASLMDEKCFLLVSVCISLSTPDTEWHHYVSPRNCLLIASARIFCSYHFLYIYMYLHIQVVFFSLTTNLFLHVFKHKVVYLSTVLFLSSVVNHISSFVFLYPFKIS